MTVQMIFLHPRVFISEFCLFKDRLLFCQFLTDFCTLYRYISAANPPVIVHCSAGIGRTGVLILMDTALALMEQREPVYPLDIVQTMRDQRACMVQNAVRLFLKFLFPIFFYITEQIFLFRVSIDLFVSVFVQLMPKWQRNHISNSNLIFTK